MLMSSSIASAETTRFLFDVDSGTKNIYTNVKPGDHLKGKMKITLVDKVDGTFTLSFKSALGDIGDANSPLNMGNWIKFPNGNDITINAQSGKDGSATVPFDITLPKTISPGDYIGLMTASLKSLKTQEQSGAGVSLSAAIGVTMKFSVAGKRVHKLTLLSMLSQGFTPSMDKEKGPDSKDLNLAFSYKADGNSSLRPSAHIVIKSTFGKVVYDQTTVLSDITPGRTMNPVIKIPDVDTIRGWFTVHADLSYSPVSIDGKVEKESFSAGKASIRVYLIPWLQIFILFGIILIGIGIFAYRLWKMSHLKAISVPYTIKSGDTLQSVCGALGADPKDIIFVNKISAPYFLIPNTSILIPQKNTMPTQPQA